MYSEYRSVVSKSYRGYEERLEALFGLGSTLDRYFDEVLVNSDDEAIRGNRRAEVGTNSIRVYWIFGDF